MRAHLRLVRSASSDAATPPVAERAVAAGEGDYDLLPVWIILWVGSVARVVAGLVENETFSTEATLALLCVAVIPWMVLGPWIREQWLAGSSGDSNNPWTWPSFSPRRAMVTENTTGAHAGRRSPWT